MCTQATLDLNGQKFGPYGMPGHGVVPTFNATLPAQGEAVITAVFDPAAHGPAGIGKIARTIILETSDGASLEVGFSAFVTP